MEEQDDKNEEEMAEGDWDALKEVQGELGALQQGLARRRVDVLGSVTSGQSEDCPYYSQGLYTTERHGLCVL